METPSDYGSDFEARSAASDYGSDFSPEDIQDTLVGDLLVHIAATAPDTSIYPSIEGHAVDHDGVILRASSSTAPVRLGEGTRGRAEGRRRVPVEVEYDCPSRHAWNVPQGGVVSERATDASTTAGSSGSASDARSPLERFRTKPKKPLSVTDLVSPAWCELQYFYALSKFGRKPRTAAMKTGSRIHQALEEQVHKIVPVQVQSKEDRFGLRIWNTIQGLRTLRETGLTRELDVWGVVNGEVVNGVIDEVSYTCHDPEFKERVEGRKAEKSKDTVGPGQLRLDEVFSRVGKSEQMSAWLRAPTPARDVYISDVKTRGVRSVPAGASLRPTWMQLMLYRKLLESLSSNTVDAETVLERYSLSPLKTFTEVFMFEIGRLSAVGDGETVLGDEAPHNALQGSEVESHPNLLSLWSLMITEFQHSITSINDILRAEFRYSKTGDVIGSALTVYDTKSIEEYLGSEMQWWKGEREAKGVAIEEAFKCRVCDFAEECSWRKNKIEEATEKHRLRARSRGKSAV